MSTQRERISELVFKMDQLTDLVQNLTEAVGTCRDLLENKRADSPAKKKSLKKRRAKKIAAKAKDPREQDNKCAYCDGKGHWVEDCHHRIFARVPVCEVTPAPMNSDNGSPRKRQKNSPVDIQERDLVTPQCSDEDIFAEQLTAVLAKMEKADNKKGNAEGLRFGDPIEGEDPFRKLNWIRHSSTPVAIPKFTKIQIKNRLGLKLNVNAETDLCECSNCVKNGTVLSVGECFRREQDLNYWGLVINVPTLISPLPVTPVDSEMPDLISPIPNIHEDEEEVDSPAWGSGRHYCGNQERQLLDSTVAASHPGNPPIKGSWLDFLNRYDSSVKNMQAMNSQSMDRLALETAKLTLEKVEATLAEKTCETTTDRTEKSITKEINRSWMKVGRKRPTWQRLEAYGRNMDTVVRSEAGTRETEEANFAQKKETDKANKTGFYSTMDNSTEDHQWTTTVKQWTDKREEDYLSNKGVYTRTITPTPLIFCDTLELSGSDDEVFHSDNNLEDWEQEASQYMKEVMKESFDDIMHRKTIQEFTPSARGLFVSYLRSKLFLEKCNQDECFPTHLASPNYFCAVDHWDSREKVESSSWSIHETPEEIFQLDTEL